MSVVDNLSIGYAPYSSDFSSSGDRRRFVYYANSKAIDFEIAKPENEYDVVFVTHGADITVWSKYDKSKAVIVYELVDSYLATPVFSFHGLFRGLAKYLSGKHKYCELNQKKSILVVLFLFTKHVFLAIKIQKTHYLICQKKSNYLMIWN